MEDQQIDDTFVKEVQLHFKNPKTNAVPAVRLVLRVIEMCNRAGVSPFENWVYLRPQGDGFIVNPSINWMRLMAQKTGRFLGVTETLWMGDDGMWVDVWLGKGWPLAAKKGVYVLGNPNPSWGVAMWKEFGGSSPMWSKMPAHMLAKVAERIALQTVFPADIGTGHIPEEWDAPTESPAPQLNATQERIVAKRTPKMPSDEEKAAFVALFDHPAVSVYKDGYAKQVDTYRLADLAVKTAKVKEIIADYEAKQAAAPEPKAATETEPTNADGANDGTLPL